jgi:hypothetical protein
MISIRTSRKFMLMYCRRVDQRRRADDHPLCADRHDGAANPCDSGHGHSARQMGKLLRPLCQRVCSEEFRGQSETLPGSLYL